MVRNEYGLSTAVLEAFHHEHRPNDLKLEIANFGKRLPCRNTPTQHYCRITFIAGYFVTFMYTPKLVPLFLLTTLHTIYYALMAGMPYSSTGVDVGADGSPWGVSGS